MPPLPAFLENTRNLVAAGNLSKAITAIKDWTKNDGETNDYVLLLSQRYATNEKNNNLGIMDPGDYARERNKVANTLLSLLTGLQTGQPDQPNQPDRQERAQTIIQHAEKIYNIEKIDTAHFS